MTARRAALALCVAAGLAGCATTPAPVAPATAFDRALAEGYARLAADEFAESDFLDGLFFRRRAREAEAGAPPSPDDLAARAFDPETRAQLAAARARLIAAADAVAQLVSPDDAAAAQIAFDCWAQEAEERLMQPELARCREAFEAAVARLESASGALAVLLPNEDRPAAIVVSAAGETALLDAPFAGAVAGGSRLAVAPALDPGGVSRTLGGALGAEPDRFATYTLYFETGGAQLTPEGETAFRAALDDARSRAAARISVFGHADRVGSQDANVRVSRRRAEAIAAALVAEGLPAAAVSSDSFGEARPAVATADGVAEPRNRRVEILVR